MKEIVLNSEGEPEIKDKDIDLTYVKMVQEKNNEKDIDLTYVKMAQEKKEELDNEKLIALNNFRKSVEKTSIQDKNNSKKQPCHGEKYRGKKITKKQLNSFLIACGVMLAGYAGVKGVNYINTIDEYNRILHQKTMTDTSIDESLVKLSNHEKMENYKEAFDSLEPENYDISGNRIDGKPSKYYNFDKDSIVNLTEKQIDAIDLATDKDIEESKNIK